MQSIIYGSFEESQDLIENNFNYFDLNIRHSGYYQIILLKLENYKEICVKYNQDHRNYILFGIENISKELFKGMYNAESITIDERHIAVLINALDKNILEKDFISNTIKKIQQAASDTFHVRLSSVISSSVEGLNNVKNILSEAEESAKYLLFSDRCSILNTSELDKKDFSEYAYPFKDDEKMIENIRMGNQSKACEFYEKIIAGTKDYVFDVFYTSIMQISLSLNTLAISIRKQSDLDISFDISSIINNLAEMETIQEINDLFYDAIALIIEKSTETSNEKHLKLINIINNIIEINYDDPNLNIGYIAEKVNLSVVYLGQLYKKYSSRSIMEDITEQRMKKAKKLLVDTSLSINEIVKRCGFISSAYFYPLFKKYNGLTPSAYRKSMQNESTWK